jgi:predicted flap endonuclease-1-like 5' DNA nuclease
MPPTAPTARRPRASRVQPSSSPTIAALPNLGPRSAQMLAAAGITTLGQLRRLGAVEAYARVRQAERGASLNLLYALEGALRDQHWQAVRREQRLELLTALDDRLRAQRRTSARGGDLLALRNIGPAMKRDLDRLGIRSCAQLARADADRLYLKLQRLTGRRHDPCVWDSFAAAIHQARTGEALPWWDFTRVRKQRMADGSFVAPYAGPGAAAAKGASGRPTTAAARVRRRA